MATVMFKDADATCQRFGQFITDFGLWSRAVFVLLGTVADICWGLYALTTHLCNNKKRVFFANQVLFVWQSGFFRLPKMLKELIFAIKKH